MNAKKELLELADGEPILAISIGDKGWSWDQPRIPRLFRGRKIEEALNILDFEFDSGYGGEEGYSLYAWTKSKVIIKGTYDGSEWYGVVPRNPSKDVKPESIGGG